MIRRLFDVWRKVAVHATMEGMAGRGVSASGLSWRSRRGRLVIATLVAVTIASGQVGVVSGAEPPTNESSWELPIDTVELDDATSPEVIDEPEPPRWVDAPDVAPAEDPLHGDMPELLDELPPAPLELDDQLSFGPSRRRVEPLPARRQNDGRVADVWRDQPRDPGRKVHLSIEIDRSRSVDLVEHRPGAEVGYHVVCESPCDRTVRVEPGSTYVVTGPRVLPSHAFRLPDRDRVTLRVRGGRHGLRLGGFVVVAAGMGMLGTSAVMAVGASGIEDASVRQTRRTIGVALLGTGIIGIVGGVLMVLRSRTRVSAD